MKVQFLPAALLAVALGLSAAPPALAGGAAKAVQCQTCHGRQGMATMPGVPNLAGQNDLYLAAQLRAFRSGARASEVMAVVAKALTEQEIEDLAAFYSQIKIAVVVE